MDIYKLFSSPLSGTFFQWEQEMAHDIGSEHVFVPSLGDFFSMT